MIRSHVLICGGTGCNSSGSAHLETALEKELAAKTGKDVALVAYSPIKYAELSNDAEALAKITELEALLSKKTGKDIVLVAFSV